MNNENLQELSNQYWLELDTAYSAAKQLLIEAEEKLTRMRLFPAPLLEHRDALDHLMRYSRIMSKEGLCEAAIDELTNAKQHEIRAFFDIADYICVIVRSEIADTLAILSIKQIKKIWSEYETVKSRVISISNEIATIRKNRTESIDQIAAYQKVVEEIFKIYNEYQLNISPRINRNLLYYIKKFIVCNSVE